MLQEEGIISSEKGGVQPEVFALEIGGGGGGGGGCICLWSARVQVQQMVVYD